MITTVEEQCRAPAYRRNSRLEELLATLNGLLASSEQAALDHYHGEPEEYPIVFVVGPHRSGTTLFMQWLANTGAFGYPTNILSRFYAAPLIGAQIQLLLTDPRYNFRNELSDIDATVSFDSENGKTRGALGPNEFWYFWRRFLPFKDLDWLADDELLQVVDQRALRAELTGLTRLFRKPFALKAMILNYNIAFLDAVFAKALFVQIRRDPVTNVASMLDARKRQLGSEKEWYSFRIREYGQLENLDPIRQVAGQLHYINKAVTQGMAAVDRSRKLVVEYEQFCRDPGAVLRQLVEKLGIDESALEFRGPRRFTPTRGGDLPNRAAIERALADFADLSAVPRYASGRP